MIENRRWDPLTGPASATLGTSKDLISSMANIVISPAKVLARSEKRDANTAAAMLMASAKSVGRFHSNLWKGTMVDIPLAVTEGLRAVPRFYGEEVRDTGTVTDFSSGMAVAGKVGTLDRLCCRPVRG